MDPGRYKVKTFGEPRTEPGQTSSTGYVYYLPREVPRNLALDQDTVLLLSEADGALGFLQGLGRVIRDPDLLIGPFLTREAVASSRIEGTRASLSDVLKAERIVGRQDDDIEEVVCYMRASRLGFELIGDLPITQRLITQVHESLMSGVRGSERQPGVLRSSPVWVGSGAHTLNDATYVPPAPRHVGELLTDWENFVNLPTKLPVLVRCALMHYQFETIHPFLDGNGRIGRLLVGLMLVRENRLTTPLLYLSGYLESHRSEYYERLQAVREAGEIQEWLKFFLRAVKAQADDAVSRARKLIECRENYLNESRSDRSRVAALIPLLFSNPFVLVADVQRHVGVSDQGARDLLARAEKYGWVQKFAQTGRGNRGAWLAREVYETIDEPLSYATEILND